MNTRIEEPSTFQSIFFSGGNALPVRVPDYQRAFSWEEKQIKLFIGDLLRYHGVGKGYYFGHFIAEDIAGHREIVDGQQRITTFVLFLMVCRVLSPSGAHSYAYSLLQQFSTVSYDREAMQTIDRNLGAFLETNAHYDERNPPPDAQIIEGLNLRGTFTRSQRRMVLALLRFHQAFQKVTLERENIDGYIAAIMTAHCSHHLTEDKSVAVNIFEMHNTRGVPLTTLEIVKAMLMKFVYDHGGKVRELNVEQIQASFGDIYGMEERVAARSFRGEMTMEQLLRLHLRVVDDGAKRAAKDFHSPATNANSDDLVDYVNSRLHFVDGEKTISKQREAGVQYALSLAKEFKKSVRIICEVLPQWDEQYPLVGDVLILERDLSCQFFLIACRCRQSGEDKANGKIENDSLMLWERLLFTRDFHDRYHGLWHRDNFEALFEACRTDEIPIVDIIRAYLENGFRPGHTDGLKSTVTAYLKEHREIILEGAFNWHPWKTKMIYAIYKYEIARNAKLRSVMKGTISVEHILPQEWKWEWIDGWQETVDRASEEKEVIARSIQIYINGLGNLLLLTPGENTSVGNNHPADKVYSGYCDGGSYKEHDEIREKWRSSKAWSGLIRTRGEEIFNFMLSTLVDGSEKLQEPPTPSCLKSPGLNA